MKIAQAPANAAKCSEAQRPKDSLGYPVNGIVSVTSRTHISGLTNCHVIKITNMAHGCYKRQMEYNQVSLKEILMILSQVNILYGCNWSIRSLFVLIIYPTFLPLPLILIELSIIILIGTLLSKETDLILLLLLLLLRLNQLHCVR